MCESELREMAAKTNSESKVVEIDNTSKDNNRSINKINIRLLLSVTENEALTSGAGSAFAVSGIINSVDYLPL